MKTLTPWLIGFFLIGLAVVKMLPPKPTPGLDIDGFARLPVLVGGRVMPMDTLGRLSLLANESSVIRITHWIHDPRYNSPRLFSIEAGGRHTCTWRCCEHF
jgi:hypothetical protein